MLSVIIPDPDFTHGECRKELHADSASDLAKDVRIFIDDACYGASDVGGRFNLYRDGNQVGYIGYNGSIHFNEKIEVAS